jgi:hypothetical protein
MSSNANTITLHNSVSYFFGANLITLISGIIIEPPVEAPIDKPVDPPINTPVEVPVEMPVDPPISQ